MLAAFIHFCSIKIQAECCKAVFFVILCQNHVASLSVVPSKIPWQETPYVQGGLINNLQSLAGRSPILPLLTNGLTYDQQLEACC